MAVRNRAPLTLASLKTFPREASSINLGKTIGGVPFATGAAAFDLLSTREGAGPSSSTTQESVRTNNGPNCDLFPAAFN